MIGGRAMKGFSLESFKDFVKSCSPKDIADSLKNTSISLMEFAKKGGYPSIEEAAKDYVSRFANEIAGKNDKEQKNIKKEDTEKE